MKRMVKRSITFSLAVAILTIPVMFLMYRISLFIRDSVLQSHFTVMDSYLTVSNSQLSLTPDIEKNNHTKGYFRLAVAPIESPEKSYGKYEPLAAYIAHSLGMRPKVMYRSTYMEVNDLLKNGLCDLAVVCTYPFIRGDREFGLIPLVIPVIKGKRTYRSLIIVKKSDTARSVMDLKGSTFCSADVTSTSGWLFPAITLLERGQKPLRFFREHSFPGSHDKCVMLVADGTVRAAAVHSVVWEHMSNDIREKTRILESSDEFTLPPLVMPASSPEDLVVQVKKALLKMDREPEGKDILSLLGYDSFSEISAQGYRNIASMVDRWEAYLSREKQ